MKIVEAVFQKTKIFFPTLYFECRLKTNKKKKKKERKRETGIIYKGTPDIDFDHDWAVGLGAILADGQKIKNYFSSFKDFFGKSR